MQELLNHPAVQAAAAPFVVALAAALLLRPIKLGGLAVVTGFATAVLLIAGFEFTPLTATRKIILVALLAAPAGLVLDVLVKSRPTAVAAAVLGAAAVTIWVFLSVLRQKEGAALWLLGGGTALCSAWIAGWMVSLRDDAVRAGAATLALGLGTGVAAVLGASASFGQYGIALAASGGAFLLSLVIAGAGGTAGATLALAAAMSAALLAGGTLVLASLPWAALGLLALVPVAVRLPLPERSGTWMKAAVASVYALVPAAAACVIAWKLGAAPAS